MEGKLKGGKVQMKYPTGRTRFESSEAVNFIEKIGMLGTITVSVSKRRKENERGQLRLMAQLLQITAIPLTIV